MTYKCNYCGKDIKLSDWEEELISYHNGLDLDDVDGDTCISPYRLNVSINPTIYYSVGEYEEEQSLISDLFSEMCIDCKNDLINTLKLSVYNWKKKRGII